MIKSYFSFFTLVFCVFLSLAKAEDALENREKALYAVTSLKFYLTQTLSSDSTSSIKPVQFDELDIANLWLRAFSESSALDLVQEAKQYYDYATLNEQNQEKFKSACQQAIVLLDQAWNQLNPYTIETKFPPISCQRALFSYPSLDNNPYVTSRMRREMVPYLLPYKYPVRPILDQLTQSFRVLKNREYFALAGFVTISIQPTSKITLASHPALPGYLFKVYLDCDKSKIEGRAGWSRLTRRCEGAQNVRQLIKKKNLMYFNVPDKWLYPPVVFQKNILPEESVQPIILIVTDMDLVSLHESVEAWKTKVTYRHIDELYCILSHGFASGFLPFNIPYTKSGKFSCVDTEYPEREVDLKMVREYLSPEMRLYWDKLVRTGGKI